MNIKKLSGLTAIGIAAIAACALVWTATASLKNPVTRPFRIQGSITAIIDLATGEFTNVDVGVASHGGRYVNEAVGQLDLHWNTVWAIGTATTASGDQLSWEMDTTPYTVFWTGGTGRFEGVTEGGGGFVYVPSVPVVTVIDQDTAMMTFTYLGTGTIAY